MAPKKAARKAPTPATKQAPAAKPARKSGEGDSAAFKAPQTYGKQISSYFNLHMSVFENRFDDFVRMTSATTKGAVDPTVVCDNVSEVSRHQGILTRATETARQSMGTYRDGFGNSVHPLHVGFDMPFPKWRMSRNPQINLNALHRAALFGRFDMVKRLIEVCGMAADAPTTLAVKPEHAWQTPDSMLPAEVAAAHFAAVNAAKTGDLTTLKYLVEVAGCDINARSADGQTVLTPLDAMAPECSRSPALPHRTSVARYLLQTGRCEYDRAKMMRMAAEVTNRSVVQLDRAGAFARMLLEEGAASVDEPASSNGVSVLAASFKRDVTLNPGKQIVSLETPRALLEHGADVNGRSAIYAANLTNSDGLQLLLDYGADPFVASPSPNEFKMNCPLFEVTDGQCNVDPAKLRLLLGLNPPQLVKDEALRRCEDAECAEILIKWGADPCATDEMGNTSAHSRRFSPLVRPSFFLKRGVSHSARNNAGRTPLSVHSQYDAYNVVDILTNVPGVDVNAADHCGVTPLMYCFANPSRSLAGVNALLAAEGIDVNARTTREFTTSINARPYTVAAGSTVLHFAARFGQPAVIQTLIQDHKANPNITDADGRTAFNITCP